MVSPTSILPNGVNTGDQTQRSKFKIKIKKEEKYIKKKTVEMSNKQEMGLTNLTPNNQPRERNNKSKRKKMQVTHYAPNPDPTP